MPATPSIPRPAATAFNGSNPRRSPDWALVGQLLGRIGVELATVDDPLADKVAKEAARLGRLVFARKLRR